MAVKSKEVLMFVSCKLKEFVICVERQRVAQVIGKREVIFQTFPEVLV